MHLFEILTTATTSIVIAPNPHVTSNVCDGTLAKFFAVHFNG